MIVFDPRTGVWREVGSMTGPRARLRLVASGGYLYAIGGVGRFDESCARWSVTTRAPTGGAPIAPINESRTVPCAVETIVGHRRVLVVVGGSRIRPGFFVHHGEEDRVRYLIPGTGKWQTLDALLPLLGIA